MKKFLLVALVTLISITLASTFVFAGKGNNLPPGKRFMLNVIAFENCPAGDFTGSNRHMIAVQADFGDFIYDEDGIPIDTGNQAGTALRDMIKTNTISLTPTPADSDKDFRVIDGNACGSKGGAEFMLPTNPFSCPVDDPYCLDPDNDPTFQEYEVHIRLVGAPKSIIGVTTCAVEPEDPANPTQDDLIVCSTENVIKVRMTGKGAMKFDNVSRELLTICLDTTGNGNCDTRYALFDPALYNYFWQWNTVGKAHAQLVFIPVP